jgi:hypothetical protein
MPTNCPCQIPHISKMKISTTIKMKEFDQMQNLKRYMWIRLRRILAYTTSYYRKKGMHLPKSPAEENKWLRSDPVMSIATSH